MPAKPKHPASRARLEVVLAGDRRLAENVILEVRALAERYGLEVPEAKVVRETAARPKARKATPRRQPTKRRR